MSGPAGALGRTADPGGMLRELARSAARIDDPLDVFMLLSERAADVLPVAAGAVLVSDRDGTVHVVGASHSSGDVLDALRVMAVDGPGQGCLTDGTPVMWCSDGAEQGSVWPSLSALLDRAGFPWVHAFPMLAGSRGVGFVGFVGGSPLDAEASDLAQAFADLATLALLRSDPAQEPLVLARRTHRVIQARATLGQAVGMIAERYSLVPEAALTRILASARENGLSIGQIAEAIVKRSPLWATLDGVARDDV